jgi:hypothetical protein
LVAVRLRDEAAAEGKRIVDYRRLHARMPRAAEAELGERRTTLSFARRRKACRLSLSPTGSPAQNRVYRLAASCSRRASRPCTRCLRRRETRLRECPTATRPSLTI